MTYTAYSGDNIAIGITSIDVKDLLNRDWNWSGEKLISPPGESHKNFVLFPEKLHGKYAILHSITPRISIVYLSDLEFREGVFIKSLYNNCSPLATWELALKGAGPPPIKTREGWLLLYHGLDRREPWKYKVGAMLLDLKNPAEVLFKSKGPIIEPTRGYEYTGFKPGVTYACGAVVKKGMLLVYYGAADTSVCVAYIRLKELLEKIMDGKI